MPEAPLSPRAEEDHQDGLPEKIGAAIGYIIFVRVRSNRTADFKAHILARPAGSRLPAGRAARRLIASLS
jgi:hypothetical protein